MTAAEDDFLGEEPDDGRIDVRHRHTAVKVALHPHETIVDVRAPDPLRDLLCLDRKVERLNVRGHRNEGEQADDQKCTTGLWRSHAADGSKRYAQAQRHENRHEELSCAAE